MTDKTLRELEREWRRLGDPEVGRRYLHGLQRSGAESAALLETRMRLGDVAEDSVRLAAALGHRPARELVPEVRALDWTGPEDERLREKLDVLEELRLLLGPRFLATIAADWADHVTEPGDSTSEAGVSAIRDWVGCPCEEHRFAAEYLAEAEPPTVSAVAYGLRVVWDADPATSRLSAARCSEAAIELVSHLAPAGKKKRQAESERSWQRKLLVEYVLGRRAVPPSSRGGEP